MSVREQWDNLSPNAKQAAVIGGGLLAVGALTAGSFLFEPPRSLGSQAQSPRDALVRNILTDADPRQMGMEALVNRLERMEKRMGELRQQMDTDARRAPQAPAPSTAERDQAMSRAAEVQSLQARGRATSRRPVRGAGGQAAAERTARRPLRSTRAHSCRGAGAGRAGWPRVSTAGSAVRTPGHRTGVAGTGTHPGTRPASGVPHSADPHRRRARVADV